MKKYALLILLLFGVILILGCTGGQQQTPTQNQTNQTQQPQQPSQPAAPTPQPPSVPRSITDCMNLISTTQLTTTCAGIAQSVVWDHKTTETGNYNGVTKVLATSICGEVYRKTDSSNGNLGEIEVVVFDNGKQGSKDVCMRTGSETLSNVGDKACVVRDKIAPEVGFVHGNYYVYIGPSSTSTATTACDANQTIAVAKLVDTNVS